MVLANSGYLQWNVWYEYKQFYFAPFLLFSKRFFFTDRVYWSNQKPLDTLGYKNILMLTILTLKNVSVEYEGFMKIKFNIRK